MRHVTYANESFVTTDEMAAALVEVMVEVALGRVSVPISVPAIARTGQGVVQMIVGPHSELIVLPDDITASIDAGGYPQVMRDQVKLLSWSRRPDTGQTEARFHAEYELDI